MRFKYSKILTMLLLFTFFLTILSPLVLAVEAPGFELPVTVKLRGSPPTGGEDYRIVLKSDNLGYPMPEGSKDGIYNLIIRGENTVKLPKISFLSRGIYSYTVYQLAGTNNLATYDDKQYNLVVSVVNARGNGLETMVTLYLLGEEGKLDEVIFDNEYRTPPPQPPTPPPTPPPVTPVTPVTPVEPEEPIEEEEIEEEIPEGIPEVEEPEEPIEEEEIEEEIPEGLPTMPKTGDISTMAYYGLGTVLIGLGIGIGRKKKD
ncbi:MAG: FctA domain-containing protein [Tissierellaceae bacterium]|nr:FctA domain-containing protein [Tissierellaceae bacterium]